MEVGCKDGEGVCGAAGVWRMVSPRRLIGGVDIAVATRDPRDVMH